MKTFAIKFPLLMLIGFTRASNPVSKELGRYCSEAGDCYISVPETYTGTRKTWAEAQDICRGLNSTLPIVDNPIRRKGLADALKNLTSNDTYYVFYWIGANASDDGGATWRWVDGSKYTGTVTGRPWSFNKSYASTSFNRSAGSMQVYASLPTASYPYICQFPSAESNGCVNKTGQIAYRTGNVCYVVFSQSLDWFSARNNCLERGGGDLVSFQNNLFSRESNSQGGELLTSLLGSINVFPDMQQFWIGLRSSWWNWTDATTGWSEDLTYSYWNKNQPDGSSPQCITADEFIDGVPSWSDKNCVEPQSFICQVKNYAYSSHSSPAADLSSLGTTPRRPSNTSDIQTPTNELSAQKSSTTSIIPLAVGIGVGVGVPLLLAAIVVIVVLSIRRKRKRANNNTSHDSTNAFGRDSKDNNSKPANQHPSEGAYAFVAPQGNVAELQPAPTKPSGAPVYEGISFNDEPM